MSFSNQISKFARKTERAAEAIFRGTSLDLSMEIIKRTPVDQGFLKGGWIPSVNSPSTVIQRKADKQGTATINSVKAKINTAQLGDSIYLINNLPYAKAIEEGHSYHQAPQGMVRITVINFQNAVKRRARMHKK